MKMETDASSNDLLVLNEEVEPTPEELDKLYQKLENGESFELSWKCPGRRLPTPVGELGAEAAENMNQEQLVTFTLF